MKKMSMGMICFSLLLTYAQAVTSTTPSKPAPVAKADSVAKPSEKSKITYSGTLIDNQCATANKDSLGAFTKTHTKACALMPSCAASGYSLYSKEGTLMPFTNDSNKKVEAFLRGSKSLLTVTVVAEKVGNEIKMVSIKNKD